MIAFLADLLILHCDTTHQLHFKGLFEVGSVETDEDEDAEDDNILTEFKIQRFLMYLI